MKKIFILLAIAFSASIAAEPVVFSSVKGPVVLGHLDGKTESVYIPFSKTDGDPVIATEKFAMPRTGADIINPFTLVGMHGGNKLWLAKYVSGTGHKDAPTDLSSDSQYIVVGGREYGNNSYRGIGYGYVSASTDIAPVFAGILERNTGANTYGDFVIATRGSTSNVAPSVRLSVTYDGRILAAPGYEPKDDEALTNKNYVDDLIADLQKQIDDLRKK